MIVVAVGVLCVNGGEGVDNSGLLRVTCNDGGGNGILELLVLVCTVYPCETSNIQSDEELKGFKIMLWTLWILLNTPNCVTKRTASVYVLFCGISGSRSGASKTLLTKLRKQYTSLFSTREKCTGSLLRNMSINTRSS